MDFKKVIAFIERLTPNQWRAIGHLVFVVFSAWAGVQHHLGHDDLAEIIGIFGYLPREIISRKIEKPKNEKITSDRKT